MLGYLFAGKRVWLARVDGLPQEPASIRNLTPLTWMMPPDTMDSESFGDGLSPGTVLHPLSPFFAQLQHGFWHIPPQTCHELRRASDALAGTLLYTFGTALFFEIAIPFIRHYNTTRGTASRIEYHLLMEFFSSYCYGCVRFPRKWGRRVHISRTYGSQLVAFFDYPLSSQIRVTPGSSPPARPA